MTTKMLIPAVALALLATSAPDIDAQILKRYTEANSSVTEFGVASNNHLYFAGAFTNLTTHLGVGAAPSEGGAWVSVLTYSDDVLASIPDGSGGFYVAGDFEWADDQQRSRIAHVASDGTLDAGFDPPTINGAVRSLLLVGSNLYAGGDFTTVDGATHNHLARFNAASGDVDANFTIGATGGTSPTVLAIECNSDGTAIYIGGTFTTVGSTSISNIARITLSPSIAVDANFTRSTNGTVRAIRSNGSTRIYIGGDFTTVFTSSGSENRARIAKLNEATGDAINGWNPGANAPVWDIEITGSSIMVSGEFTQIDAKNRKQMAKLTQSDGIAGSGFVIGGTVNGIIRSITAGASGTWYVGGSFTTFDGVLREHIARVDGSGNVQNWTPGGATWTDIATVSFDLNNTASGIFSGGEEVYNLANVRIGRINNNIAIFSELDDASSIGGIAFRTVGGTEKVMAVGPGSVFHQTSSQTFFTRNDFAEWDRGGNMTSNQIRPTSGTGGQFQDIATWTSTAAIVVGNFTSLEVHNGSSWGGATSRTNIAHVDFSTSPPSFGALSLSVNGTINEVTISGNIAYVAGAFTSIGGSNRAGLAAIDLSTGSVTGWDPNPNGTVNVIVVSGNGADIYLGGAFTSVGGASRNRVAKVDNNTGSAANWDPNCNGTVSALALSTNGGALYVGGSFTTVASTTRNRIAAVSTADGSLDGSWDPNCNGTVSCIAFYNSQVVIGGSFSTVLGKAKNNMAAITPATINGGKSSLGTAPARLVSSVRMRAYPNPTNGESGIELTATDDGWADLRLYSPLGVEVRRMYAGEMRKGETLQIPFRRDGLAPGTYLLRVSMGGDQEVERIVIVE